MVFNGSFLIIADNSGARFGKCIGLEKNRKSCGVGQLILLTLHKFKSKRNKRISKKTIYLGIIVSDSFWHRRVSGDYYRFFFNRTLVFNTQFRFLGSKIYGLVNRVFKKKIYVKHDSKFFYKTLGYSCTSI